MPDERSPFYESNRLLNEYSTYHETAWKPFKKICVKYNLSLIEGKILCFLHNNPTKDTAADIVELRMLSKGNVSSAIDKLCKQGYIQRVPDKNNRRKIHLSLLSKADDINKDVDLMLIDYKQKIFDGFTMEEMHAYKNLC